jgi:hypothetical protein
VAGQNEEVPPEGKDLLANGRQQQRPLVAAVRFPDGAGRQGIAGEDQGAVHVAHRVVRVPGCLQDRKVEARHGEGPALVHRTGRKADLTRVVAVHRGLVDLLERGDPLQVSPVGMGQQYVANVETVVLDQRQQARVEDPGVDEHRVARSVRPQQVRVGETLHGEVAEQPHEGSCPGEK